MSSRKPSGLSEKDKEAYLKLIAAGTPRPSGVYVNVTQRFRPPMTWQPLKVQTA